MAFDPKDPWFYNRKYLETLSSWPGRTPEELGAELPKYVLILAAMCGDSFQIQRILCSEQAKIDDRVPEYAGTALWYACHKGHYDLVDYLLDGSPDMYAVNTEYGTTPYQEAEGKTYQKLFDKKLAAIAKANARATARAKAKAESDAK